MNNQKSKGKESFSCLMNPSFTLRAWCSSTHSHSHIPHTPCHTHTCTRHSCYEHTYHTCAHRSPPVHMCAAHTHTPQHIHTRRPHIPPPPPPGYIHTHITHPHRVHFCAIILYMPQIPCVCFCLQPPPSKQCSKQLGENPYFFHYKIAVKLWFTWRQNDFLLRLYMRWLAGR